MRAPTKKQPHAVKAVAPVKQPPASKATAKSPASEKKAKLVAALKRLHPMD